MTDPHWTPAVPVARALAGAGADAAIVADGDAGLIIARLLRDGWTLDEGATVVAGKRIRIMHPPRFICPSCGATAHIEHERGLLFCGACGTTWPLAEEENTDAD